MSDLNASLRRQARQQPASEPCVRASGMTEAMHETVILGVSNRANCGAHGPAQAGRTRSSDRMYEKFVRVRRAVSQGGLQLPDAACTVSNKLRRMTCQQAAPAGLLAIVRVRRRRPHAARLIPVLEEHISPVTGGAQAASSSVRQSAHGRCCNRCSTRLHGRRPRWSPAVLSRSSGLKSAARPLCPLRLFGARSAGRGGPRHAQNSCCPCSRQPAAWSSLYSYRMERWGT